MKKIYLQDETLLVLSGHSRRGQKVIWGYNHSGDYTINDAYTKPSIAKVRAYDTCNDLRVKLHGVKGRIAGKNCHFFNYIFTLPEGTFSEEGYNLSGALIYITASHTYIIL